ncbi:MAG: HEAT repeat domain-containing protein, partial [Planctomycetes bacterium]|nr:HEAT repeat domain-containing protein [Planctomycetota bacterium]
RSARIRAVRSLARSKDDAGVQLLASVLDNDEDPFVRGNAAVALGKTKAEPATALLAAALEDDATSVRINAVRALGRVGGDLATWILGDILLDHPDRNMRWMATRALAKQHSEAALRLLELATTDSDPTVRKKVERSLAQWQSNAAAPLTPAGEAAPSQAGWPRNR